MDDLPVEILSLVFSNLNLSDLLRASSVNSHFQGVVNFEYFRRRRCLLDCHPKSILVNDITFAEVRHILFTNYGHVIGLWGVCSTPYGGLIHVKFDGFKLVGTRYYAPSSPHIENPLRSKKLFTVQIYNNKECEIVCHRGFIGPHFTTLELGTTGFRLQCSDSNLHRHPAGTTTDFEVWLCEELGIEKMNGDLVTQLLKDKHKILSDEALIDCYPLRFPMHRERVVIQPGIFKGTYSAHGIELVLLNYDDDDNVTITKITGDTYVPAGKITIQALLHRPVVLTEAQQTSLTLWSAMNDIEEIYSANINTTSTVPFRLPDNFHQRYGEIPEFCKARFRSQGQIAEDAYSDPRFITGHWVVFNEDSFGHLWFLLSVFAMFSRVKESFTNVSI